MLEITVVDNNLEESMAQLEKDLSSPRRSGLWSVFDSWLKDIIEKMFDKGGGSYGRASWPGISPSIYGKKRKSSTGGNAGRYSASSKPLHASGKYKNSFGTLSETDDRLLFGSNHSKADVIPNAGWQTGRGARIAMPDPNSVEFRTELDDNMDKWMMANISKRMRGK